MLKKKHFFRKQLRTHGSLCLTGQRQDVPTFDFEAVTAGLAASGASVVPKDPQTTRYQILDSFTASWISPVHCGNMAPSGIANTTAQAIIKPKPRRAELYSADAGETEF